jgi:hydrogenase large subunit
MDRIAARSQETLLLTELMRDWLMQIQPTDTPPLTQNSVLVKQQASFPTDAMRGALLHSVRVEGERVAEYNIITPTVWNFSARDALGNRSPVEEALIGTQVSRDSLVSTTVGRIVLSFDPCISCATHLIDARGIRLSEFTL